jgi:hypothetical protein
MSIVPTADLERAPSDPLILFAVAAACVTLADWLFFGWDIGISLAQFLGLLGVVAVTCNRVHATRGTQIIMSAVFIAGLLALIEDVSALSVIIGMLATALFVVVMTDHEAVTWQRSLLEAVILPLRGPFQLAEDFFRASSQLAQAGIPDWMRTGSLIAWIVPVGAFAIFLYLFSAANPLIEYQLTRIDLQVLAFDPRQIGFWILVFCAIWPLILRRVRTTTVREPEPAIASTKEPFDWDYLFGAQALLRSLILCNALFALQSVLDLTYLWGGVALPNGMSHAEYAHRGAYPLVATALLAAGFALIAMRPNGPADNSRLIRRLVLVWIGQNILLVISSILRLDLYIAAFSLTYLRIAAFIWMGLVATGLTLMLIQIVYRKSNAWLLSANAISLALVLYGCCFLNAPWLVAYYNVEHCREVGGSGPNLDMEYLTSLGSPQTLPPIEAHLKQFPAVRLLSTAYRESPDRHFLSRSGNWRAWTFRRWRLERYFANTPGTSFNSPDNGKG